MVIGTTGFDKDQLEMIKLASAAMPIVLSANMSIGMNVLFELVARAATLFNPVNMTIHDSHHRSKKDAPSGSAKTLGDVLAKSMNLDISEAAVYDGGANILEEEAMKKIFFTWRRSSAIIGDHTVFLGGIGEELRLSHSAHDREPFALGAIRAAKWIVNQNRDFIR
jgi:4-hydroxy-tetrahydrodipicolinate reductase